MLSMAPLSFIPPISIELQDDQLLSNEGDPVLRTINKERPSGEAPARAGRLLSPVLQEGKLAESAAVIYQLRQYAYGPCPPDSIRIH